MGLELVIELAQNTRADVGLDLVGRSSTPLASGL